MGLVKSSHQAYDAHYHVVFPVKYRKALLSAEVAAAMQEIAGALSERYDIEFEKIGTDGNHVHLLCSFHPKYGMSDVVRIFKSIFARELFRRFPALRKDLWGGELWSEGYYFATVGTRGDWSTVERYVARQGKATGKHLQLTLWQ